MATSASKPRAANKGSLNKKTTTKRKTVTKVAAKISGAGKAVPKKAKAPAKKKPAAAKKKLGNAKPKVTMKKVAKGSGDHWFDKLTKKAQVAYIKAHPNSKYAKGRKAATVKKDAKAVAKSTGKDSSAVAKSAARLKRAESELRNHSARTKYDMAKRMKSPFNHKSNKMLKDKVSEMRRKHKELVTGKKTLSADAKKNAKKASVVKKMAARAKANKKAAAKKPAVKKTAAKKPTVKKPAAKKLFTRRLKPVTSK